MRLSDITVEVRNVNLDRIGVIRPEELNLELLDPFNQVGNWKLTLPTEHLLANVLSTPGSGIIVTGIGGVLTSGPMTMSELAETPDDPGGTISFEGVSDSIILSDSLSLPDPTNPNGATQTLAHDVRRGVAETVMHSFVEANIGTLAPLERRKLKLIMGANLGRGPDVVKSARFPVLGKLLSELATLASLGFRVVQRGGSLVFETSATRIRTKEIRLDVSNGALSGQRVAVAPPGLTRAIVAGQGDLEMRQFLQAQTAESVYAEQVWGRRIERFIDQRNTGDWSELEQAGAEALEDEGRTTYSVQAVPAEDAAMELGRDWGLGDMVSVISGGQELPTRVTGMHLKADSDGFRVGVLLGDPTGFDPSGGINGRVTKTESRVSQLERTPSPGGADGQIMSIMGVW